MDVDLDLDEDRVREAARADWRAAAGFEELCELGALFVEGRLQFFPGWGACELDRESAAIAPLLAAVNRAGLLTLASQRGSPEAPGADGRPERRRAFVLGFARVPTVERLEELARRGLEVLRGTGQGRVLPLGLRAGEPFLVADPGARPTELAIFAEHLAPAALAELSAAELVWVVDPEWGRDERLWPALAEALGAPERGPAHRGPWTP